MAKYTIDNPKIEHETNGRLVLATGTFGRIRALFILSFLALIGLVCIYFGIAGNVACLWVAGGILLLLGGAIILRSPFLVRLTFDDILRLVTVEHTHLIGMGFIPRVRQFNFALDQVTSLETTENRLSTAFGLKIHVAGDVTITLKCYRDESLASILYLKLSSFVSQERPESRAATTGFDQAVDDGIPSPPTVDGSTRISKEVAGVTYWRLALAAVFGLLTAMGAAWIWYLVTKTTNTKLALLAIFIGFAVGLVVSLMSGGNRDERYSLLGAGLSAVGVIAGEVLIYGNLELGYRYELSIITVFIYILAVWEGWVIPRRSMRLVRENSGRINERTWRPLLYTGLALLMVVLVLGAVVDFLPMPNELSASLHAQLAYGHMQNSDLSAAAGELKAALRDKPDWAQGHVLLGDISNEKALFTLAEQSFLKAIEHDPDLYAAHLGLAKTYLALDRKDDSLAAAQAAKNGEVTNGQSHWISGYIYFLRDQWQAAEADFSVALNLGLEKEDNVLAHLLKGHSLLNLEDYPAALAIAENMISDDPNNSYAHYLCGQANFHLGNRDRAKSNLNTALTLGLDPESETVARSFLADLD